MSSAARQSVGDGSGNPEPTASPQTQQEPANNEAGHKQQENSVMVEDPLPGMSDRDRYGIKGFFAMLKGPHTDQIALSTGVGINSLGLDLTATE